MKAKKNLGCPQCGKEMQPVEYDIGFGVEVNSLSCPSCMFHLTDEEKLEEAIGKLKEKTTEHRKVIKIGSGVGVRLSNKLAKEHEIEEGQLVEVIDRHDGILIRPCSSSRHH